MPQTLLPLFPEDTTQVNSRISFHKENGQVWYFHYCVPMFTHPAGDLQSFRMFASQMVVTGNCKQAEMVRAFGISAISMKRHVKKHDEGGPSAFYEARRARGATVLTAEVTKEAQELLSQGKPRSEVGKALGLKDNTLYKAIRAGKLVEPKVEVEQTRTKSERSVEDSEAAMGMACTRVVERVCAALGKLPGGAASRFEADCDVANGGVLWALPALLENGLLHRTKELFQLPAGFYTVVQIFLLLAFMALARVKAVERLRHSPSGEWGKLLGLDRIPEVRTLREKLKELAKPENVKEWASTLSKEWLEEKPEVAGVLYVDGHVRVYHGREKLPRRYVSRQRLCLRGMIDYWVNDEQGRPFFVVTTESTSGMLAMLRTEIIPRLLKEVPGQPTEAELAADPYLHRFAMVFDREAYSPAFFAEMWRKHRIACQTYHKYPKEDWAMEEFEEYVVEMAWGEQVKMKLAERGVLLGGKLWVREIRKLTESGHQVSVVSTDFKSAMALIARHMFARWSQENFFRYMMEHFNIDALTTHKTEEVDETKEVVNPAYRQLDRQVRSKRSQHARKLAKFGALTLKEGLSPKEMEAYERKKGELSEEIDFLSKDLEALKEQRAQTSKHITVGELPEEDRFAVLAPTRKQFVDTIKMIAYRAETAMAFTLRGVLTRPDDARALLREIFTMSADLIPNEEEGTLTVRLHHLTNPLSDRAACALAKELNDTETRYPGTNLRLVYELVSR